MPFGHHHSFQRSRYCRYCDRRVLAEAQNPDYGMHAVLSLFTCGLWLGVYVCLVLIRYYPKYRCQRCGTIV